MVIGKNAARIILSLTGILLLALSIQIGRAQHTSHGEPAVLDLRGTWLENQSLVECETSTACSGLWEFGVSADGTARWSVPPATCLVVVQKITPNSIEILRVPSDSSPVIGQYSGTLNSGVVEGEVTWTFPMMGNTQKKEHWFASLSPANLQAKLGVTPNAPQAAPRVAPLTASERGFGADDRLLIATETENPTGLAVDANGNFLIADNGDRGGPQAHRIIRIQAATGAISTVFGGMNHISDEIGDVFAGAGPTGLLIDDTQAVYTLGASSAGRGLYRISATGGVTEPLGLTLFDMSHITGRPSGPPDMVHVNLLQITGLTGDGEGNLYLAGKGVGVSKFNLKTRTMTPIVGGVMDLFQTKVVVPLDGKGIAESDWTGEVIPAKTLVYDGSGVSRQTTRYYNEISYDPRGNLYVQTNVCVARVVLAQNTVGCLPGAHFVADAMAVSKTGELFVTQRQKIYRYDEAGKKLVKIADAPPEDDIGPIAVDRSGAIYLLCKGYIQRIAVPAH